MGLDAILEGIRAAGQAQIEIIQQKTETEVQRILAEAKAEVEQTSGQAESEELPRARREQARILQHARLEALHTTENASLEQVNAAIESARKRLSEARSDPNYPVLLSRLIQESLNALETSLRPGEGIHLQADPRDRGLIEAMGDSLPGDVEVLYNLDSWGGVNAASGDEKVYILNTLEVRLERALPELQRRITALFRARMGEA